MITSAYIPSDCHQGEAGNSSPNDVLIAAFLAMLQRGKASASAHYGSAARHFLLWLDRQRIPLTAVDDSVVQRFAQHKCRCPRYSSREFGTPVYISRVTRFVRFLEDRGDIPVTDDLDRVTAALSVYADHLKAGGYGRCCQRRYRSSAEHFACWLRLSRFQWRDVDNAVIERFALHDCHCPLCRKHTTLRETGTARRRRGALRFLAFLRERGMIATVRDLPTLSEDPCRSAFGTWLKQHRGIADTTIEGYLFELSRWLPALGSNPAVYDAATIRSIVLDQGAHRSPKSIQRTATVVRAYLRFLAARGECRPELSHAIPPVSCRRLATLPRYASPAIVERIIASCDITTPVGLRDRAIILLLARLGLRAGDIRQLKLSDVDWANALLRVHGKNRRSVNLPLSQDAGDALLAYLEGARPAVRQDHVFLLGRAPFTPFASSSEISGIVARALARSGVEGVPTGAHMFRHSLATKMLRMGASLEAVGTILRHRSPNTTAIYAKVDIPMLIKVAQPWLGDAPC